MTRNDAYAVVTERIIEALEQGIVPWHQPWRSPTGLGPRSLASGKPYRGINVWTLAVTAQLRGYTSPYWLTFKQAKERGGSVRKGEKGTQIVLWKPVKKTFENENGEKENGGYLLLRYFTVFNSEQCDGIEVPTSETEPVREHAPIEEAQLISDRFIGVLNGPQLQHGGGRAFYMPALDRVQMPLPEQFESAEHYYGTLFHELAHSTGHDSRLKREGIGSSVFGSPDYSKEELVAEMAAAFLCGDAGIDVNVPHRAGYIASWLKALKDDRKLLVHAAAAAQKAADCVLGVNGKEGSNEPSDLGQLPRRNHERSRFPAPLHRSAALRGGDGRRPRRHDRRLRRRRAVRPLRQLDLPRRVVA
jgi:antirestriction protein ArdC